MDVGAVKAPTIRRSHTCKRSRQSVSISPSLFFKSTELTRQSNRSPSAQAPVRFAILSEATAVPHRHRSLRFVASLVTRAQSAGAYGAFDAAGLREALRQAAEERCCRR